MHTIIPKPLNLSTPNSTSNIHYLSSSNALTSPLSLLPSLSSLSLSLKRPPSTLIRMGGGPRTYPGGVSKWQWKRMQAKKSKQLLKARLARERQIYEMRKRAELKAAVSDLERPWELVQKAAPISSSLFSVTADDQLKVLADRFQKPGGFDMWTENDGPQIFMTPDEGLPTARFFPKGVVHSVRPYGRFGQGDVGDLSEDESSDLEKKNSENRTSIKIRKNGNRRITRREDPGKKLLESDGTGSQHSAVSSSKPHYNGDKSSDQRSRKNSSLDVYKSNGDQKSFGSRQDGRKSINVRQGGHNLEGGDMNKMGQDGSKWSRRQKAARELHSENVYDMSLQGDGNYGFIRSEHNGR